MKHLYIVDYSENTDGGAERFSDKLVDFVNDVIKSGKCLLGFEVKKLSSIDSIIETDKTSIGDDTIIIFTASWLRKSYTDALILKENKNKFYDLRVFLLSNVSALTPFSYLYDDIKHHFVHNIEEVRQKKAFDGILCLNPTDEELWTQMGFSTYMFDRVLDACARPRFPSKLVLCYMNKSNAKCIDENREKAFEVHDYILKKFSVDVPVMEYTRVVRQPEEMFDRRTILFHKSLTEGRAQVIVECLQCGGTVVGGYPEDVKVDTIPFSRDAKDILRRFRYSEELWEDSTEQLRQVNLDVLCKPSEPNKWWTTLVNMVKSSDASWSAMGFEPPKKL